MSVTDPDPDPDLRDQALAAAALLEEIVADRGLLSELGPDLRKRLLMAAGRASHPDSTARRQFARARLRKDRSNKRDAAEALLSRTGIRQLRKNPLFKTPRRRASEDAELPGAQPTPSAPSEPLGQLAEPRTCYVCHQKYTAVHRFYDHLCLACGDFNYAKRSQTADLTGQVALLTGARVKIGYQAAIMLLRAGARVIVTTRFPRDAVRRYAAEADFADWADRIEVHGLDLRRIPDVERFCDQLARTHDRLDHIINNACQTVRRPPGFYQHLVDGESGALSLEHQAAALLGAPVSTGTSPARLSQIPLVPEDLAAGEGLFPVGQLDADQQQLDLRRTNSWRLRLDEVSTVELLEVQLVNAVAPYLINGRLRGLMARTPGTHKHIVNVSAMEGQFYRTFKSDRHPHTNMAKAALNMMTRTSAPDYVESGVNMNSVDTGWVTDEDPVALAERKREVHRFHPPLDIVDGAARIVDPILSGANTGEHLWGHFLKDYRVTDW